MAKLGDILTVKVDSRANNGSDEAVGLVVGVPDNEDSDDELVNLRIFLDGDAVQLRRNVPVLSSAPDEDDEDAPSIYAVKS